MALYANLETDENSKKNKARQQFLNSYSNLGDDLAIGIEDIDNPDFGYDFTDENFGIGDISNINLDGTRVSREVPEDDDTPQNARSFLANSGPTIQEIMFNRAPNEAAPTKDIKTQDKLKKYATARGVGELVKALSDTFNLTRGGINAQGTQADIPMVLNQIMQIDQNYLKEMQQYRDNQMRRDLYNTGVANDQMRFNAELEQNRINRQEAQNRFDKEFEEKKRQFQDELKNAKTQAQAERALKRWLAGLEKDKADADRLVDINRQFNYGIAQNIQGVEEARQALILKQKEIESLVESGASDLEINSKRSEYAELERQYNSLSNQLFEKSGYDLSSNTLEGQGYLQPDLLNAAVQQNQNPQRPPVSPGSTQVDNAVSNKSVEKPDLKVEQVVSETDKLLESVIKSKKVNRDNLRILINAFQDRADASGQDFDKQGFIEYLKGQGVEVNLVKDDLDKIISSIDDLFTRKKQDNIASR